MERAEAENPVPPVTPLTAKLLAAGIDKLPSDDSALEEFLARKLAWAASHFDEAEQENDRSWKALCPGHDDSNASLGIYKSDKGWINLCCRSHRCSIDLILEMVGLKRHYLAPDAPFRTGEVYVFNDENSTPLFRKWRKLKPDLKKGFDYEHRDKAGTWIPRLGDDTPRVLYRLDEILNADPNQPVFVCEGEKDVDRCVAEGLIATTNHDGANGRWRDEYTAALAGRHVVVVPDNDRSGISRAELVADALLGVAATVKVLALPGLREKGDVSDWFNAGGPDRA